MILVDSSVWIDYFRGWDNRQTDTLDRLLGNVPVLMGDLILAEVLQGLVSDRDYATAKRILAPLQTIELGGLKIAVLAAENYRWLRRKGITVRKTVNTILATRCIHDGIELLHNDRDFEPFRKYLALRVV